MMVMKFGGSSVVNAGAIRQVSGLIGRFREEDPVVVVSALQGVTDDLIACAKAAAAGEKERLERGIAILRERHEAVRRDLGIEARLADLLEECELALRGIASLRELSPRSLDLIVSFGERISAPLVAAALRDAGIDAVDVDARTLIRTDDRFTSAEVRFEETNKKIRDAIIPLVESGRVPVVTGFIGATGDGVTTTLGRGGSDYTAAILGGALSSQEIWIWKEVDGIMTADPGTVADASVLSEISYDEAAEMSYFGAKVLHPKTMIPAIGGSIPFRIRNTFHPERPGTRIGVGAASAKGGVRVVSAIKKLAMVTVEGKGMSGMAGFAATVFSVAGRLGINILMFTQASSEQNICLVVSKEEAIALKQGLESALSDALHARWLEAIRVEADVAAVAAVGEGMRGRPGIAAAVFTAVAGAGISVLAIAQGSSERNISFIVHQDEADAAVRAVHAAFHLAELNKEVCASSISR